MVKTSQRWKRRVTESKKNENEYGISEVRSISASYGYTKCCIWFRNTRVSVEEREKKALESLQLVGLDHHKDNYPSQLSGGMQQRVGIARALTNNPDVLLMDESFSALDPLIRKEMQDELLELQDKMEKTIIFITHDLDEALRIGDRIALMKDGEIVQIGTPEEIMMSPLMNS
ncbi:ATP-binding cassette domain-containing protein [Bacillus sp. A17A.1]